MSSDTTSTSGSSKDAHNSTNEATFIEWDAELQELESKTQRAVSHTELELQSNTKFLRTKWHTLRIKLHELHSASAAAQEDLSSHFNFSVNIFEDELKNLQARFRNPKH